MIGKFYCHAISDKDKTIKHFLVLNHVISNEMIFLINIIRYSFFQAEDWSINSVGLEFSHSYGFGLMDAGAMVRLAKTWEPVPIQHICTTEPGQSGVNPNSQIVVKPQTETRVSLDASNCDRVKFLEHLHLFIDLTSGAKRGDLSVTLISPAGTTSTLLAPRPFDEFRTGFSLFRNWPMMSVHFWGEPVLNPELGGDWTMIIGNNGDKPCVLNDWQLSFYGTAFDPQPGVPVVGVQTPVLVDVAKDDDAEDVGDDNLSTMLMMLNSLNLKMLRKLLFLLTIQRNLKYSTNDELNNICIIINFLMVTIFRIRFISMLS